MEGSIEGTYNHFNKPSSQVSAHFGVANDGRIWQFVPTDSAAYANGQLRFGHKWLWPEVNPNRMTISIETEGKGTDLLSPKLYDATKWVCERTIKTYSTIRYLYAHNAISPTQCPGPRWTSGNLAQLANQLNLELIQ